MHFKEHENILDIILTSNLVSRDFIFGQSDLNFLIIVPASCHPKQILREFRQFIKRSQLLSLTVNQVYIPILTEDEIQTDVIKSFLIRKSSTETLAWPSILSSKTYSFKMRNQDKFAVSYSSMQDLDYFFLRQHKSAAKRGRLKNINRSLKNLVRLHPAQFLNMEGDSSWVQISSKLKSYPFIASFLEKKLYA